MNICIPLDQCRSDRAEGQDAILRLMSARDNHSNHHHDSAVHASCLDALMYVISDGSYRLSFWNFSQI